MEECAKKEKTTWLKNLRRENTEYLKENQERTSVSVSYRPIRASD